MGNTTACPETMQNPDLVKVVTLSDAAVQRLPLLGEEQPLSKENREQKIDDYWREQLECLDNAFDFRMKLTEEEFTRLEQMIIGVSGSRGKYLCEQGLHDVELCYINNSKDPLRCVGYVKNLILCIDTLLAEAAKKERMQEERKTKKSGGAC